LRGHGKGKAKKVADKTFVGYIGQGIARGEKGTNQGGLPDKRGHVKNPGKQSTFCLTGGDVISRLVPPKGDVEKKSMSTSFNKQKAGTKVGEIHLFLQIGNLHR